MPHTGGPSSEEEQQAGGGGGESAAEGAVAAPATGGGGRTRTQVRCLHWACPRLRLLVELSATGPALHSAAASPGQAASHTCAKSVAPHLRSHPCRRRASPSAAASTFSLCWTELRSLRQRTCRLCAIWAAAGARMRAAMAGVCEPWEEAGGPAGCHLCVARACWLLSPSPHPSTPHSHSVSVTSIWAAGTAPKWPCEPRPGPPLPSAAVPTVCGHLYRTANLHLSDVCSLGQHRGRACGWCASHCQPLT